MKSTTLTRADLAPAARHFARACRLSRAWSRYVTRNIRLHGDVQGNHTSGCYSPEWPETVKKRLRKVAYAITEVSNAGYSARPSGVHGTTLRSLASAIARRDGSGYYGPQP